MITKRMLGLGLSLISISAILGSFLLDFLEAGEYDGIGPQQLLGIKIALFLMVVGFTLIPLGDRPA